MVSLAVNHVPATDLLVEGTIMEHLCHALNRLL